jgi:hypothetical protein
VGTDPEVVRNWYRTEATRRRTYARIRSLSLDIQPGAPDNPGSIRVALLRYIRGEDGRLFIAPECTSFEKVEEVEGQLDFLQDDLDEISERARRPFQVA